jgi:hypothetical protein
MARGRNNRPLKTGERPFDLAAGENRDQAARTRIATATKLAIDRRCGRSCIVAAKVT